MIEGKNTAIVVGREGEESEIEVRCSLLEDAPRIAALLEFHGMPYRLANEERFLVAKRSAGGEILAALEYRTVVNGLTLGVLVTDPRVKERPLARALYAKAHALAGILGVGEVRAQPTLYGDYPYEVGYWRWGSSWHCCATESLAFRGILPERGWRGIVALWRVFSAPSFEVSSKQAGAVVEPEAASAPEVKH